MKIEFIESFLSSDKMFMPSEYDADGFYYNKKENSVIAVMTTQSEKVSERYSSAMFIGSYDSLETIHKVQHTIELSEKAKKEAERDIQLMNAMQNSKAMLVPAPSPTISESFALKMLSIAMKNDKIKDFR